MESEDEWCNKGKLLPDISLCSGLDFNKIEKWVGGVSEVPVFGFYYDWYFKKS